MRNAPRVRSIFASRLVASAGDDEQPRVLDDLRRAIVAGDEPPGTAIPLDAVATFFGVSRIPVREALAVLLGEGLVEHRPHAGWSVAQLTFAELRELYDVRQALESAALRVAVERATGADDALVHAAHAAMTEALPADDDRAYHRLSRGFHLALIAPARMPRLAHLLENTWNLTEPVRPMSRVEPAGRQVFHDDHDRLVAAFTARDADALLEHSRAHFDHLREAIEDLRDDPSVFRPPAP